MSEHTASLLDQCDEALPLLGVTREFDFGQFIELFDSTPDPKNPNIPAVARVVIQPSATLAADRAATTGGAVGSVSSPLTAGTANRSIGSVEEREVHLFDLTENGPGAKLTPSPAEITDSATFFGTGIIEVERQQYRVSVDEQMRTALSKGLTVTAYGEVADGDKPPARVPLKLSLPFEPVSLNRDQVNAVIAGGQLSANQGEYKPALDAGAVRALLAGKPVLTHGVGADGATFPVELIPSTAARQEPMSEKFEVFDLHEFLANPALIGSSGEILPLGLKPDNVRQLVEAGRTEATWEGRTITLDVPAFGRNAELSLFHDIADELRTLGNGTGFPPLKPPGRSWQEILEMAKKYDRNPHFVHPFLQERELDTGIRAGANGSAPAGAGTAATPTLTGKVQSRLPSGTGLPVAVFVPWKQTWTLKGFSRGNLLHSIAMAPQEEITLQVFSWERRTRSLEQSAETETDQTTEVNQTTRDTEDVFREMLSKRDFAWQLSGSLDASYSNGVASIQVGVDGSVSDTTSIQQTARNSSQQVRESSIKATARVRSRRVTRITQTVETGREDRVTRVIRNPNQCHTLTLDFFESLAHYEIKLEFVPQRMRLVVLVPNPIQVPDFSSEIVRRNETTLRNALIEGALVDGFEACRMVAAYDEAKGILLRQEVEAAKAEELPSQRDQDPPAQVTDPAAPQQAEVERIAGEMTAAITRIRSEAEIDTAMAAIRDHKSVTEEARRKGQYWLFINFCAAKFPSLLTTLDDLAAQTTLSAVDKAQKMLAVLPKPDAPTNLGNLNEMSDKEKEESGIASKIKEPKYMQSAWDWAWWTGRLREESLYSVNDAGLGGLADQLSKAFQAWEAKKAQGAAMKDQEVAKTEAQGRQDKANADDKLTMAFPLDELARAYERQKVLRDHLNEHREFYNYALFQALPPSEQALRIVEASNGRLQVGLFEPRVVAMNGSRLAVPLTPLAGSQTLRDFVTGLRDSMEEAFEEGLADSDTAILPTPGVSVSSRLGECSGCEEYIEKAREYELKRLEALAQQEVWEATRRQKRIEGQEYGPFVDSTLGP